MTMRYVCSWQQQSTSKKDDDDSKKNLHMEFAFFVAKVSHLGKKLPLSWLLTVCCPNWTKRTQERMTANLAKTRQDHPAKILIHRKVCQIF
ncbi:hypothetical protein ACQP3L_29975, partial [Escherichia coli]